jgi:3-dehydroquinate dehydratase II
MLQIAILNGPNLNLIGTREQHIYGSRTLDDYFADLQKEYPNVQFTFYQSNIEGEMINFLHSCRGKVQGVIMNGGAYTHTSIAIADAIAGIDIPVVEVHISNIYAREEYRKHSYTAEKCAGCITGLGLKGYALAVEYFIDRLQPETT